ncbi:MAG TPA: hypothetical protein VHY35_10430 [Stellaceae bacterium]|jgi:hypothetical protein|nr:hypothetical protein [Stellaceae bacterium]
MTDAPDWFLGMATPQVDQNGQPVVPTVPPSSHPDFGSAKLPDAPAWFTASPPQPTPAAAAPEPSFMSNLGTTVAKVPASVAAIPRTLADVWVGLGGGTNGLAGAVQKYMPNVDEATDIVFRDTNKLLGTDYKPYKPQSLGGQIFQDAVSGAPLAAVGPGGWAGLLGREGANLAGASAADTAAVLAPNSPGLQVVGGLLGAAAGGGVPTVLKTGTNIAGRAVGLMPESALQRGIANDLSRAAGVNGTDLVNTIDSNMPTWQFPTGVQPAPNLAEVTGNQGVRNMVYNDMAQAGRSGDPIYQQNAQQTAAAQQAAVANAAPNLVPGINAATATRDAEVGGLSAPVSAQSAGQQFRSGLQGVYDQRSATRAAQGGAFDALDNSPAVIDLRPIMDYATEQAAKNAGSVGSAYASALGQFRSGTGITLDSAPFANSTLKGLGDLADSLPPGSAARRAVLDVKGRAEDAVLAQAPEVAAARDAWTQASRPLDVFQQEPFASTLKLDNNFGRQSYTMPNDAVVSRFLTGNGSADALDKLHSIFPDPQAATSSLQDYIAGRVRSEAVNPDGSVNIAKMQAITAPYQNSLMRFPALQRQFSSVQGAQQAVDTLNARQELIERFNAVPYGNQSDANAYNKLMRDNAPLVQQAYGPQGAATLAQVNDQLDAIAATGNSVRVRGQSGTSQSLARATGIGGVGGTVLGAILGHFVGDTALSTMIGGSLGGGAAAGAGAFIGWRQQALAERIDTIRRNALSDPTFARKLLEDYNPKLPSSGARKAMSYVVNNIAGALAPQTTTAPYSKPQPATAPFGQSAP